MISKEALYKLRAYHWPGNVRELENFIRKAVLLIGSLIEPAQSAQSASTPKAGEAGRTSDLQDKPKNIETAILQAEDVDRLLEDDFANDSVEIRRILSSMGDQVYNGIIRKGVPMDDAINFVEKGIVEKALVEASYKQAEAARRLGITERSVWHLVKKHKIDVGANIKRITD